MQVHFREDVREGPVELYHHLTLYDASGSNNAKRPVSLMPAGVGTHKPAGEEVCGADSGARGCIWRAPQHSPAPWCSQHDQHVTPPCPLLHSHLMPFLLMLYSGGARSL